MGLGALSGLFLAVDRYIVVDSAGSKFALTDLIGPLLLAGAAVVAATLAATTAKSNHRGQLRHDRAMLSDQLRHDQEMRGLEHLRQMLDKVVEQAQELFWAIKKWDNELAGLETRRASLQSELPGIDEDATEALNTKLRENDDAIAESIASANRHVIELNLDTIRLILRFGEDHVIVDTHEELKSAVGEAVDEREIVKTRNRTKEELAAADASGKAEREALATFLGKCRDWFVAAGQAMPEEGLEPPTRGL